jgi:hypothetical protein
MRGSSTLAPISESNPPIRFHLWLTPCRHCVLQSLTCLVEKNGVHTMKQAPGPLARCSATANRWSMAVRLAHDWVGHWSWQVSHGGRWRTASKGGNSCVSKPRQWGLSRSFSFIHTASSVSGGVASWQYASLALFMYHERKRAMTCSEGPKGDTGGPRGLQDMAMRGV